MAEARSWGLPAEWGGREGWRDDDPGHDPQALPDHDEDRREGGGDDLEGDADDDDDGAGGRRGGGRRGRDDHALELAGLLPPSYTFLRRAALAESVNEARWRPFAADPSILSALREHPLPGNLRDLQRVAYHLLAALAADEPHDRCAAQALATLADATTAAPHNPDEIRLPIADLRRHLDLYRQRWIDAAMRAADGNQSAAARLLGVPRATLRDWLSGEPATAPGPLRP